MKQYYMAVAWGPIAADEATHNFEAKSNRDAIKKADAIFKEEYADNPRARIMGIYPR